LRRIDEYSLSLPRLWIVAGVICLLDIALLSSLLLTAMRPGLGAWMAKIPQPVVVGTFLYGPFVLAAMWVLVVGMAVIVHRQRGLWLLLTALIIFLVTYTHWGLFWSPM
jgi:hypothetical protein